MSYCYELAQHGSTLATRSFGSNLRGNVVREAAEHKQLDLDFSGVLSASHSFADEFVAKLAEESKLGEVGFEVSVSGASPDVEAVIQRAVGRRGARLVQPV